MRKPFRFPHVVLGALGAFCLATCLTESPAQAQTANTGFQLNRYEPSAAGEWSFWVNHPWYSSTRYFAAGVTLNYGHNPLVAGVTNQDGSFSKSSAVVAHHLLGHVDLAGSFLDRVLLSLSLPVVFLEMGGTPSGGVAASDKISVGDLRFGAMVRLFGQPYRSGISMSIGGEIWVPWRQFFPDGLPATSSDTFVRGIPKIAFGGLTGKFMWSLTAGVLLRQHAEVGTTGLGAEVNSELQLGAAMAYANTDLRLAIGPEVVASTAILGDNAFKVQTTNVEALLGLHYNIAHLFQLGIGGGVGLLRQAGTPDARGLFRFAYAPWPRPKPPAPKDRDFDGIIDDEDLCPDQAKGRRPDPLRLGCPMGDRDQDTVLDGDDLCPEVAQGARPDPQKLGCPMGDRDQDTVLDADDLCPDEAQGPNPDPARKGCPAGDRDKDGVFDYEDQCPDVHQSAVPDPQKKGCPAGDRDHDLVLDPLDACPDQPGAPSADPAKNGCPGLVSVTNGQIVIVRPVFFATNKDVILEKSYEVLQSVADALQAAKQIKRVRIEGHTDNRGKIAKNVDLSERRANSVMKWLVSRGIDQGRLEAKGYGPSQPIADNKNEEGRAKNRRVDFFIVDPPQPEGVKVVNPATVEVPKSPDQSDKDPAAAKGKKDKKDKKADKADKADKSDKADKADKKDKADKADKKDKADKADKAAPEGGEAKPSHHHSKKPK